MRTKKSGTPSLWATLATDLLALGSAWFILASAVLEAALFVGAVGGGEPAAPALVGVVLLGSFVALSWRLRAIHSAFAGERARGEITRIFTMRSRAYACVSYEFNVAGATCSGRHWVVLRAAAKLTLGQEVEIAYSANAPTKAVVVELFR